MSDDRQNLQERIRTAEEMLTRAIQQRKEALAQMTLETLEEIAPDHPRLPEFRMWVKDIGQELAVRERIDSVLTAGREALKNGDMDGAQRQLDALRKLAPYDGSTDDFAAEVEAAAQGQEATAGIGRIKQEIEEALAEERVDDARQALARLEGTAVPRIVLQTYGRRITETTRQMKDAAEVEALTVSFESFLQAQDWGNAREMARHFGQRFPDDPRSTAMFNRVGELEAGLRRQQSIQQGIASVEQFIAQGRKAEAELALKVLRNMLDDPQRIAALEVRIRSL